MAKFEMELPKALIDTLKTLEINSEKMMGEMTQAGAEVVYDLVKLKMPKELRNSNIQKHLKITKTYKTPTDDGINNKVAFFGKDAGKRGSGYYINSKGKKAPIDLVLNVFEYGRSDYPNGNKWKYKKPFFRTSFKKKEIEQAMLKVQEKYIKGG